MRLIGYITLFFKQQLTRHQQQARRQLLQKDDSLQAKNIVHVVRAEKRAHTRIYREHNGFEMQYLSLMTSHKQDEDGTGSDGRPQRVLVLLEGNFPRADLLRPVLSWVVTRLQYYILYYITYSQ